MFGRQDQNKPTRFGQANYPGNSSLPTVLHGVPIDPRILSFRRDIIDDPERLKELEEEIARKQEEASEQIGTLLPSDILPAGNIPYSLNQRNKGISEVKLSDFKIEVEDADTVILKRKTADIFGSDKPIVVRLAGIDAPEVSGHAFSDPLEQVRIFQDQLKGKEATDKVRRLLQQQKNLRLIVDIKNSTYGRSLGVFFGDNNLNINVEAARQGYVSALPFGSEEEDLVKRSTVKKAEEEAYADKRGMWQYARYQAAREVSNAIGGPITYNTLTTLTKLSRNLNVGAYESYLQQLGDKKGPLTAYEIETARSLGYALKKTHDPSRFSSRNKKKVDDSKDRYLGISRGGIGGDSYIQAEGLRHDGLAQHVRRGLTDFGSGWTGQVKELTRQGISKKIGEELLGIKKARAYSSNYVNFSRTIGSDDFIHEEGLGHQGIAWQIRQSMTDFGSGSRHAINILKNIPTFTKSILQKQKLAGRVKSIFGKSKYTKGITEDINKFVSSKYDIYDDYSSFYREQMRDLPSMSGLPRDQVEKNLDVIVNTRMSGLRQQAKEQFGSEKEYKRLLGPIADIDSKKIYRGSREYYKSFSKDIKPEVAEATSMLHEVLESEHGRRMFSSGISSSQAKKLQFGSHASYSVIEDEATIAEALGGDFKKAFISIRKKEGSLVDVDEKTARSFWKESLSETRNIKQSAISSIEKETKIKGLKDQRYQARTTLAYIKAKKEKEETLKKFDGIHPGIDNSLSVEQIRKHSDFGTGWDSIRTIAKAMYSNLDEDDAFVALRNSDLFKDAIKEGISRGGKKLGQGAIGSVTEYTGVLKHGLSDIPEEFSFVSKQVKKEARFNMHLKSIWRNLGPEHRGNFFRNKSSWKSLKEGEKRKYGEIFQAFENATIKQEANALEKLGSSNAPSLYGHGKDFGLGDKAILMEKIKGETLEGFEGLTIAESRKLWRDAKQMHKAGFSHMDLHEENIMRTIDNKNKERFAFIDFGMANKLEDTWISKNIWRQNESIIQDAAKDVFGKEIEGVKQFQQMVDESRIYGYLLEGQNLRKAGHEVHTSFNKLMGAESQEVASQNIKTIMQASKEANEFFSNNMANAQVSTAIVPNRAVQSIQRRTEMQTISEVSSQSNTPVIGISDGKKTPIGKKHPANQSLQEGIRSTVSQKGTNDERSIARKRRFYELSKQSVGAGARMAHNAARRHSVISSTKTV